MDVSYWGPSGWRLFHLITFTIGGLEEKKQLFSTFDVVLPCKYCRASAREFLKEPIENNVAVWLYDFHEKVNNKLRDQHDEDPKVPLPAKTPSFESVVKKYQSMLKNREEEYPGREFLLSVALNFDKKSPKHKKFWENLLKLYPYYEYRKKLFMPDFNHYFRDVNKMFSDMGCKKTQEESHAEVFKHKSPCKKTRKTCRNLRGGTRKIHSSLR
jgi:hypothetical protein